MNISLIATLVKRLGAVCLTFVILWHVAQHTGLRRGTVVVHVTQQDVMVDVDEQRYHVGSIVQSPLVCELEPGHHVAEVWRSGVLLGEESFTIEPGKDVIICPAGLAASKGRSVR